MFKKFSTRAVYPTLALALLFGCTPDEEQLAPTESMSAQNSSALVAGSADTSVRFKSGHFLVMSASGRLPSELREQLKAAGGNVTAVMDEVGITTVSSTDPAFASKAGKIKGVASVVRDLDIQWHNPESFKAIDLEAENVNPASSGDSNPYFGLQWGHTAIQAPAAWNAGARGKGVRVAVLDSGYDLTHPDLSANIVDSYSFVPDEGVQFIATLKRPTSHGTHVAGTIAAVDNNRGVVGVAPDAELILVKVLRDAGSGAFSWMLQGILYAVQKDADVINMSLGAAIPKNGRFWDDNGTPDDTSDDFIVNDTKAVQELLTAINKVTTYATQKGVTVIASAGNDANNGNKDFSLAHIPSGAPNVISISATGPQGWANAPLSSNLDRIASYTNYGTSDVSFAAPGGDFSYKSNEIMFGFRGVNQYVWALDMVMSLRNGGGYTWMAGTSMASPHATGIAALVIGKNGGSMDPAHVAAVLRASADDLGAPGRDPYYGYGRLNAYKAIMAVK